MLYFIATPIGNLTEITFRAIETLKEADVVYCEDTRRTAILFNHYNIKKPLVSYNKNTEKSKENEIISSLKNGKKIAVVSDAGMPLISDPGNSLVTALKQNNLQYTVISGATALINALVLSGLDSSRFCFIGFLPVQNIDRVQLLQQYQKINSTLIFYVPPHDLDNYLEFLYTQLGARKAVIVREISKIFEQVLDITLGTPLTQQIKGEIVLLVQGYDATSEWQNTSVNSHVQQFIDSGLSKNDAIKAVAKARKISKSEIYKQVLVVDK